jgi:hypothetical protein
MKKLLMAAVTVSAIFSSMAFAAPTAHFLYFKTDASVDFSQLQNKFGADTQVEIDFLIKRPVDQSGGTTSTYGLLKNLNNKIIDSNSNRLPLGNLDLTQKPDAKYITAINIINMKNSKVLYSAAIEQPNHPLNVNEDYYMHIHSLNNNDATVNDNPN